MLTTETQQFARVLTDKLAELTNQRQGRDRIAVETSPDEVEECLLAAERDIALMDLGRMTAKRKALDSIQSKPAPTSVEPAIQEPRQEDTIQ